MIVKNFNHLDIAKMYADNGSTCLSVLTEEKHFLGKLDSQFFNEELGEKGAI